MSQTYDTTLPTRDSYATTSQKNMQALFYAYRRWCRRKESNLRCSPQRVAVLQTAAVATEPRLHILAEREGFEPPVPCGTTVFKTAAINRSAISPKRVGVSLSFRAPIHIGTFPCECILRLTPNLAEATGVEPAMPLSMSRFERGGLATCPTLPWRKRQDLNLHALAREPGFQPGAIPFCSPIRPKTKNAGDKASHGAAQRSTSTPAPTDVLPRNHSYHLNMAERQRVELCQPVGCAA